MQSHAYYSFEIERLAKILKHMRARVVLIQLPDGLKPHSVYLKRELSNKLPGIRVFFSGKGTYGPCDIAFDEAITVGADVIVHYGHPPIRYAKSEIPIIYMPAKIKVEVDPQVVIDEIAKRRYKRIGLSAIIQYVDLLDVVYNKLKDIGIEVYVGRGANAYRGVVLGCDYSAAISINSYVDAHIIIASGKFHGLGLKIATGKDVLIYDPLRNEVMSIEREYRRRLSLKLKQLIDAEKATLFAVIICKKAGQFNMMMALKAMQLLRESNREYISIIVDEITPASLENFTYVDAFINTCCPRIAIDDIDRFNKPILSLYDLRTILKGEVNQYSLRL
ncbi:MAG: diphthamide biosynthesis enzyme Dph2 [Thermoprotei archaeon]|nr:MAG: diphthamide biosynthesis enzyme Dph2 [Thermoprotei archaeon]RLF20402.1 MAG: diphthamide biosynthesis enzyme Dph2 [Thermoprotei archaeon]